MIEIETDYAEVEQQADDNKRGKSAADDSKQRVCPECGAEFRPLHGSQVCCSDECKRNRLRMKWRESKRCNSKRCNARIRKLSPRQKMKINLARRDLLAPKPKTEIIERNGIVIERRGTVPLGCHAADFIRHNA